MARMTEWRRLPVGLSELCLATTLRCGQSFRWRKSADDVWSMALYGRILSLRQDSKHLFYQSIFPSTAVAPPTPPSSIPPSTVETDTEDDDTEDLVNHYLNLQPDLGGLYSQWSGADPNFRKKALKFAGVRILRQDAWEALIGFICSSNNNIIRISQMVDKLCTHYGYLIGYLEGRAYHDFPPPTALTGRNVEAHLRELGFGYRAKFIHRTAVMLVNERLPGWLDSLRNPENPILGNKSRPPGEWTSNGHAGYRAAHEALLELQGVGPKVADCVCLMGLGWDEAVPVDTHFWQIAQRDYKFGKGKHSSLTKATYDAVANHFRQLWGREAGWAHSVLFAADLRVFAEKGTAKVEIKEDEAESLANFPPHVETAVVRKAHVKRELEDGEKPALQLREVVMTSSERVKRRRKR